MTYYPRPEEVSTLRCTDDEHECVHDWRILWGNVERTVVGEGG
ncbi:hypothetical protein BILLKNUCKLES_18 [Mycobacterium phage BillKnuckles]|uniref:Uncharacterized protein n=2 Tax=Fromanvirus TaxID=186764 RepID=G8IB56_9CAUD|nr:hypothetical protein CM00_gp18 [Mycobacterium phage Kugel]YP_009018245.1 hypothetical protein CM11_gp18 [Mycobacterium phage BillKnuckles]AVO25442.1 hypothetical protein SEA_KYKAR_15 [Mycobacterium phage Kykar]AXH68039.1 hypothetical protein SEA_TARGET_19 [Mycobacterium phage Target]AER48309.1 hypothetical protein BILLKNUCKLES_18 [Mycobacterium phage BillKnuckles]AER49950.1 hypothetical protein KUGEL_18 [Mycobacterium phage Kugel]